jgi:micrococcal nuclease
MQCLSARTVISPGIVQAGFIRSPQSSLMKPNRRSFRRRSWRKWVLGIALVGILVLRLAYDHWWSGSSSSRQLPLCEGRYWVVSVVEGSTLIVREAANESVDRATVQPVRVRLLGVDGCGPTDSRDRTESWAAQSSAFIRRFVAGRTVRLRFDKRRIDPNGHYLAYVFVEDRLLNEALVQAGLARVATYPGDSLSVARRLRIAEQEARDEMRGMWSLKD